MPPVGFEPTTPAGERPQTYALDRAVAGIGECWIRKYLSTGNKFIFFILRIYFHTFSRGGSVFLSQDQKYSVAKYVWETLLCRKCHEKGKESRI